MKSFQEEQAKNIKEHYSKLKSLKDSDDQIKTH